MLNRILADKHREIELLPPIDTSELYSSQPAHRFISAVSRKNGDRVRIIAEIKRVSPAIGPLCNIEADTLARIYADTGADAISVLTDHYFMGEPDHLSQAKRYQLPVLRKDFIIDHRQLYQSRQLGADAVLLIAAINDYPRLLELTELSLALGMEPLVEVHTREELALALDTPTRIIGVNNRDLKTFKTDFNTSLELAEDLPADRIKISMSGINSPEDMLKLEAAGYDSALIGEALVTAPDISRQLINLLNYRRCGL